MRPLFRNLCALLGASVLGAGMLAAANASATTVLPTFNPTNFTPGAAINNAFLPLTPGTRSILRGSFVDGGKTTTEELQRQVLSGRQTIGGVDATVVRDRALVNGVLKEDTFDFYAQDNSGNVWYLGEDVTNYVYDAGGNLIGTNSKSAWRTGVHGGLPGYAMPAGLVLGFEYFQEFSPVDGAVDIGNTFAKDQTIGSVLGPLNGVQVVYETSMSDPTLRELKYYAPGLGLVRIGEDLDAAFHPGFTLELVSISAGVPEPSVWGLMICGFGAAGAMLRRRRTMVLRAT